MKKVIILGNKEEADEILKICASWEVYFKNREWEMQYFFVGAERPLAEIVSQKADMIVCFNLAGFHEKMFGEDIFLNKLYCPIINFIGRPLVKNELELLDSRMNITISFFTDCHENLENVKQYLEFPPYIQYVKNLQSAWEEIDLESVLLYGNDR